MIEDTREKVYRKKNGRYIPFASIDERLKFDVWNQPGLWLHTEEANSKRQMLIARINELPSSAVAFASVMNHTEELTKKIMEWRSVPISANDFSLKILEWISTKAEQ